MDQQTEPTMYEFKRRGDGASWSVSDFYDDFREELVRALKSGLDFDTGWYGVKKESQSGHIIKRPNRVYVSVSVSNDFDIEGSSEGVVDLTKHDLSTDHGVETCIEAIVEELDKTLVAAEDSQKDNDFIGMYLIGEDRGVGMSPWRFTFLVDWSGHGFEVPPGDYYFRWGWQEVETDNDQDAEAFPQELTKATADKIRDAIYEGEISEGDGEVIDGWRVRLAQ